MGGVQVAGPEEAKTEEAVSYRRHERRRWCAEIDVLGASRDARMQSESRILIFMSD